LAANPIANEIRISAIEMITAERIGRLSISARQGMWGLSSDESEEAVSSGFMDPPGQITIGMFETILVNRKFSSSVLRPR
jgi:hypothetical protein